MTDDVEGAGQVDRQYAVPQVAGEQLAFGDGLARAENAGAVDRDMHPAEFAHHGVDGGLDAVFIGDVDRDTPDLAAQCGIQPGLVEIEADDPCAGGGQGLAGSQAQAGTRAGDDCDLVVQFHALALHVSGMSFAARATNGDLRQPKIAASHPFLDVPSQSRLQSATMQ
ncbi:hypothetical protein D3C76_648790 [compost metagenome]